MAKYLKALDHLSIAAQALAAGKPEAAAAHLRAAVKHPSFPLSAALIDKFNDKQIAQLKAEAAAKGKKKKAKKAKASSWPFPVEAGVDQSGPDTERSDDNDEYGIEVEENKGLREVQEADASEGDDEELSLDDTETEESAAETAEADEGEDKDEGKDEDVEQARFLRALHNARAQKTGALARLQAASKPTAKAPVKK